MLFFRKKKKTKTKSKKGNPIAHMLGALSKRKEAKAIAREFVRKCRRLGIRPTDAILSFMINFIASDKTSQDQLVLDALNQMTETIEKLANLKEKLDSIFGNRPASERLLEKLLGLAPLLMGGNSKTKIEVEEE